MNTTFVDTRMVRAIGALDPVTKGQKNLALAQLYCWGLARRGQGHPIEISFYREQADIGSRQTIYDQLAMLVAKGLVLKSDDHHWVVCPDSENLLSSSFEKVSRKPSKNRQELDNTKSSKISSKNELRKTSQEVMKTWNSHAVRKSYLKKRNGLLGEDLTAIEQRLNQFPGVDVARVLDKYLIGFPDLLVKRAKESGRPWSLKQVLGFPTFSEKLDELRATCSSANPDQLVSVDGDPWLDQKIPHPLYWPPNQLHKRDFSLSLSLKQGDFSDEDEAEARRYYHHPEKPKK